MQVINGIVGAMSRKVSSVKKTPFLEIVVYSLDHQTSEGSNKPVYVRVWEQNHMDEFEKRLKVKDRIQIPVDKITEKLGLKEGNPYSYFNANYALFSYLYSGGSNTNTNSNQRNNYPSNSHTGNQGENPNYSSSNAYNNRPYGNENRQTNQASQHRNQINGSNNDFNAERQMEEINKFLNRHI